jgi:hypothetical protein
MIHDQRFGRDFFPFGLHSELVQLFRPHWPRNAWAAFARQNQLPFWARLWSELDHKLPGYSSGLDLNEGLKKIGVQ